MKTCYVYTVMLWKSKWDWQNITNGEFINTATMHLNVMYQKQWTEIETIGS